MTDELHKNRPQAPRPRLTTAGRLLKAVAHDGVTTLSDLARQLRIPSDDLEHCEQGLKSLELETQMRLAAIVAEVAPEHARLAHALYGQAQAALRMQLLDGRQHSSYPRVEFR
jgi:hypothetical protein